MIEYGEVYWIANDKIIASMTARMSPNAVALAYRMASEASGWDDE